VTARAQAAQRGLDAVERLVALGLYAWLLWRLCRGYQHGGGAASLFILPSEGLVVLFLVLRRRARALSPRAGDWALALLATTAPMLVAPGVARALVPPTAAAVLMVLGLLVQLHAKLTLGRSFGCVAAHRGLKLSGPYRFVRHPMYAGYFLSHVAFLLVNPSLWNCFAYGVCYALQVPRLLAEERLLLADPEYALYRQRVPWRLVPGLF
jgi:protein-S-isoprenylcysteine O-methyltransferase Ste14